MSSSAGHWLPMTTLNVAIHGGRSGRLHHNVANAAECIRKARAGPLIEMVCAEKHNYFNHDVVPSPTAAKLDF
jgi:hypothetical protein